MKLVDEKGIGYKITSSGIKMTRTRTSNLLKLPTSNLLKLPRFFEVISYLKNNSFTTIGKMAKAINTQYCHATHLIQELEKINAITKHNIGRNCIIQLTEKGENIYTGIKLIKENTE